MNKKEKAIELLRIAKEVVSYYDEDEFEKFIEKVSLPLRILKVKLVFDKFARVPFYNLKYKGRRIGYVTLNNGNVNVEADWKFFPSGSLKKSELRNPDKKEVSIFVNEMVNVFDEKYR